MNATLQVERRKIGSNYQLRMLRKTGKVPGVIYGKGLNAPTPISIDAKQLSAFLGSSPHAVVEVDVPGEGKHPIMMAEVQRDPFTRNVLHVDFRRVDMNAKINTSARLEFVGKSAGEQEGGMLQIVLHEIEIACYPKDIPDAVPVDVSALGVGEHLSIGELKLPAGVEATQDENTVIVAILAPQKERSEEELDELHEAELQNEKHRDAAVAVEKD